MALNFFAMHMAYNNTWTLIFGNCFVIMHDRTIMITKKFPKINVITILLLLISLFNSVYL